MNEFQKKKILINNFKNFQAQIVPKPLGIEVVKAKGSYIYDKKKNCLLYTSPSPRDGTKSRMPSSA